MYKINKDKPVVIKDSPPLGDNISFDLFLFTKDSKETILLPIKISSTCLKIMNISRQEVQRILLKDINEYLERNNWEVGDLTMKTRMICAGPSGIPENAISIQSLDDFKNLKIEDILI